jgi:hypothetical protein
MTEAQLAVLLRALAKEAELLGKLLSFCAAAGPLPAPLGGPMVERTINDLRRLASRAEALAEVVVLG